MEIVGNHIYDSCDLCGRYGKVFGPLVPSGRCRDCFIKETQHWAEIDPEAAMTEDEWRQWAAANDEPLPDFMTDGNS